MTTKKTRISARKSVGASAVSETPLPSERTRTRARIRLRSGRQAADPPSISGPDRQRRIAELAYYKAESRGFAPGHELEDWLEAEQEVDAASQSPQLH